MISMKGTPCHIISCDVMFCSMVSCHVMLHDLMSCHVMSCHIKLCHVMSSLVLSCHVKCQDFNYASCELFYIFNLLFYFVSVSYLLFHLLPSSILYYSFNHLIFSAIFALSYLILIVCVSCKFVFV